LSDEEEFERLRHHVVAALEYSGGSHAVEDIADGIRRGRFQLWPGADSVIVTEIIVYPQLKDLHFFLAGGDLDELRLMQPLIESWGKDMGCSRVSLAGRRGWERTFLRDRGYEPKWFVMCKDL
jgi:hypothetical protein